MMARLTFLSPRTIVLAVVICAGAVTIAGCKRAEEITSYDLSLPPEPAPTHRMLAALVPDPIDPALLKTLRDQSRAESKRRGEEPNDDSIPDQVAWFFKVVGPIDSIEKVADSFNTLISSLELRGGVRPNWTLPEGWEEDASVRVEGRDATIRTGDGGDALELTVSRMALPKELEPRLALNNINRWRGQMKLRPIPYSEFDQVTRRVEVGASKAIVVDLKGVFAGGPMSKLAKSSPAGAGDPHANLPAAQRAAISAASQPSNKDQPITYESPDSWKEGRTSSFRVAAFEISGDGEKRAEVTVIPLGREAGDLKSNADRWAGEIKLPAFKSIDEVREQLRTISVDGIESEMLHLKPPSDSALSEATIGVITRRGDKVWFFKLRGDATLVEKERERFEEFVKSVKFK
jgi:hypothetical protein